MTNLLVKLNKWLEISLLIASLVLFVFTALFSLECEKGYELLWILPLTVIASLLIQLVTEKNRACLTRICFNIMSFIRYSLTPFMSAISGIYNGSSELTTNPEYLNQAIWIIALELVIGTGFLVLIQFLKHKEIAVEENREYSVSGNKLVYVGFILLAVVLYISVGRGQNLIQFGIVTDSNTYEDVSGSIPTLIRQIIKIALFLLFLLVTDTYRKKYSCSPKRTFFVIPLALGILNVITIVGQRRAEQLNMAVMVAFVLVLAFPKYRRILILSVATTGIIMLLYLTMFKHFYQYGITASVGTSINSEFLTKSLQSYVNGIQNTAEAIAFSKAVPLSIGKFFYDLLRSIFGISFILKGQSMMTIEMFNTYIYGVFTSSGHVLSSVGYSYIFFGPLFSWVGILFNLAIAYICEKIILKTRSLEYIYVMLYVFVRFGFNLFAFSIPLINFSTMILGTAGLLCLAANVLSLKNQRGVLIHEV